MIQALTNAGLRGSVSMLYAAAGLAPAVGRERFFFR